MVESAEVPFMTEETTFLQRQWLTVRRQIWPVVVFIGVLWFCEGVDLVLPESWHLDQWGIRPRERVGLAGIAAAPFLHESISHLVKNTLPLLVLGWLVLLSGRWLFVGVVLVTALSSGLGAWLFGTSDTVHIGASGIVFGMLGFLLTRGWVARRLGWALISLVVALMFYGQVFGALLPDPHVSWSSHFWGFMGGMGFAWWLYRHQGLPAPVGGITGGTALLRKAKALSDMARR